MAEKPGKNRWIVEILAECHGCPPDYAATVIAKSLYDLHPPYRYGVKTRIIGVRNAEPRRGGQAA